MDLRLEKFVTWTCACVLLCKTFSSWCFGKKDKGLEPAAVKAARESSEPKIRVYIAPEAVYVTPHGECYRARICKNVDMSIAMRVVSGKCCEESS